MGQEDSANCPEWVSVENVGAARSRMIIELFHPLEISRTSPSTTMHGDISGALQLRPGTCVREVVVLSLCVCSSACSISITQQISGKPTTTCLAQAEPQTSRELIKHSRGARN